MIMPANGWNSTGVEPGVADLATVLVGSSDVAPGRQMPSWWVHQAAITYHRNHLYSVAAITDASGAVARRYAYGAYGQQEVVVDNVSFDQPYGHTGRRHDLETGLQFFRALYYDAALGRFTSREILNAMLNDEKFSSFDNGPLLTHVSGSLDALLQHLDSMSLYRSVFIFNFRDLTGLYTCRCPNSKDKGGKGDNHVIYHNHWKREMKNKALVRASECTAEGDTVDITSGPQLCERNAGQNLRDPCPCPCQSLTCTVSTQWVCKNKSGGFVLELDTILGGSSCSDHEGNEYGPTDPVPDP